MERFGKMILGAFVGAITNAILFYICLKLKVTDSQLNWGGVVVFIIFGVIAGVIIGGIIGLVQPKIKSALTAAATIAICLIAYDAYIFIPTFEFQREIESGNYRFITTEIIIMGVFSLGLIAEICLISKIVSFGKKKHS